MAFWRIIKLLTTSNNMTHKYLKLAMLALPLALVACSDNNTTEIDDIIDIGDQTKKEYPDDYYTGGKLGTVYDNSALAYKQPAPAG